MIQNSSALGFFWAFKLKFVIVECSRRFSFFPAEMGEGDHPVAHSGNLSKATACNQMPQ